MVYIVTSIRDSKTGWLQPQIDINELSAARNFEHAVLNNTDSLFFSHPEDYSLYQLGTWDSDKGQYDLLTVPMELITASQIIDRARIGGAKDGR